MNYERLSADHEGDAFFDKSLYKAEPEKFEPPPIKLGSPEWEEMKKKLIEKIEADRKKEEHLKKNKKHPK